MPLRHLLLGLLVVAIWGSNFVVIKSALAHLPPLFMAFLRFALAFLPAALLVPRPPVPWPQLAAYGVLIGAGQFGLLFLAMTQYISPGLASLVIQTQVFFTIALAALVAGEHVRRVQWVGLGCAAAGLAMIAVQGDARATPLGLGLVLAAAASWAAGNLVGRRAGRVDMLGYMVWSSAFALPPLLALSLLFEGPAAIAASVRAADGATWAAVVWQAAGNTLFGYAAWGWLLARHPAATVAPLALGVPVFGLASSALWLGEALPPWLLAAAALVLGGLALNLLWPRIEAALRAPAG
ncbi:MAG: EamA family transporter [Burkholderiaceae bacterium]|nr:EamA family transporter [Burkholderiaceae bacterium]